MKRCRTTVYPRNYFFQKFVIHNLLTRIKRTIINDLLIYHGYLLANHKTAKEKKITGSSCSQWSHCSGRDYWWIPCGGCPPEFAGTTSTRRTTSTFGCLQISK